MPVFKREKGKKSSGLQACGAVLQCYHRLQSVITGCFHLFTIQTRAKPLRLKVCLHYDSLTFNTAGVIQNPSQVSFLWVPSTRGARWSVICGLIWVWINLTKRGNKKRQPLESIARNKPIQTPPKLTSLRQSK